MCEIYNRSDALPIGHISVTLYDYMSWENQREFYARETSREKHQDHI